MKDPIVKVEPEGYRMKGRCNNSSSQVFMMCTEEEPHLRRKIVSVTISSTIMALALRLAAESCTMT